jgi:hypothetical protein
MSNAGDWSPDEPLDTETYESWDEDLDARDEVTPDDVDDAEGERSLDRQLVVDSAELEELGGQLDDPERMAVLDGDMDDPDGLEAEGPVEGSRPRADQAGWDLDAEERQTAEYLDADPDDPI